MGESVFGSQAMHRGDEKLCLKWNDFQENAISAFGILREDKEFADVTLACEDGHQVEAHKVILASSSPFFQNLLKKNKHPHPLIYMRGLKAEELLAMIDFIYNGEANVYQENLDSFLAVAEEFQLKGLMGSGALKEADKIENKPTTKKKTSNSGQQRNSIQQDDQTEVASDMVKLENSLSLDETVAVTDYTVNLDDLDDKIKSMLEVSEKRVPNQPSKKVYICKVCGKEGQWGHISNHIEARHIIEVSHNCDICGKAAKSRTSLSMHKRKIHSAN